MAGACLVMAMWALPRLPEGALLCLLLSVGWSTLAGFLATPRYE